MKKYKYEILLSLFAFSLCIVFFMPYVINGHDTAFHVIRIESMITAIQNRDYFPKVFPYVYDGFGYGIGLFYSNFFLYIPVLLCLIGVPVLISYKIFMCVIIFATVFSSYWCATNLTKNKNAGIICAIIYTGSAYFSVDLVIRNALGESMAFIFLPFIVYGMYQVVLEESKSFVVLAIGFAGLLLSHNISLAISAFVFAVFLMGNCIRLIKDPHRIFSVLKATVVVMLGAAFFLFPMVEQLLCEKFFSEYHAKIFHPYNNIIHIRNLFIGGNLSEDPYFAPDLGLFLLCATIFCMSCLIPFWKKKQKDVKDKFFVWCLGFGLWAMVMSTSLFPWYNFDPSLNIIQFPSRFHMFSTLFISFGTAIGFHQYFIKFVPKKMWIFLAILLVTGSVQFNYTAYQGIKIFQSNGRIITGQPQFFMADENYLHGNNNRTKWKDRLLYKDHVISENPDVEVTMERDYFNRYIAFSQNDGENHLEVPAVYYLGYEAVLQENGEKLSVCPSEDGWLEIDISNISEGNIIVKYAGTWVQKVSSWISVLFFVGVCFKLYFGKRLLTSVVSDMKITL